jgi:protein disulfide-isomerase
MRTRIVLAIVPGIGFTGSGQAADSTSTLMQTPTMKVEIWSDVMCPFCYIGKRKFEAALAQLDGASNVELIWKSFQLDPDLHPATKQNTYQYLAERKGMSYDESVRMHGNVVQIAQEVGLDYRFDISVVANSFDAHRLSHLAKAHGLGNALEERLFHAYFTEGKDIADHATLVALGTEAGLNAAEITAMLNSDQYADAVKQDSYEAQQIGVRGVPFFVFDRKYAVSGAQSTDVFLETLTQSFAEWKQNNPSAPLQVTDGPSCTPDGECD